MNFYNLGVFEALIKLGASGWTPEEIRAHKARLLERLKDVPWGEEPIPQHVLQSIRQQTTIPIAADMKTYNPSFRKLPMSLMYPGLGESQTAVSPTIPQQVAHVGQGHVDALDRTAPMRSEAVTPPARPLARRAPQPATAVAQQPAAAAVAQKTPTGGAMARLKQLLRLAPKG